MEIKTFLRFYLQISEIFFAHTGYTGYTSQTGLRHTERGLTPVQTDTG